MKYIKILGIVLGILLILLLIDYIRIAAFYFRNKTTYTESFSIQGNSNGYVPQGLAYSEKYDMVLQTSYNKKHEISMLYVIDFKTRNCLKEIKLLRNNGNDNCNHVGGITTDGHKVWITSDYEVNEYSLDEILNTNETYIKSLKDIEIDNGADFCTYHNNILWIGEFFLKGIYNVKDDNPLLMGYVVKENIDYENPDYIISIPNIVQGLAITSDNKFIFSRSYSNFINSSLSIYENILQYEPKYYEFNGNKIAYYEFNKNNMIKNVKLPPMSEEIFIKDKSIYILFESSSDKYFYAYPKIKKILKFDI